MALLHIFFAISHLEHNEISLEVRPVTSVSTVEPIELVSASNVDLWSTNLRQRHISVRTCSGFRAHDISHVQALTFAASLAQQMANSLQQASE
jgi:hypothetical protein